MKIGLVLAIAVGALLLGALIWWKVRPSEAQTPVSHSQSNAAPSRSPAHPSEDQVGREETTRSETARAAIAPQALEGGVAAPGVATPAAITISQAQQPQSIDEEGNPVFERKYAWMSGEERREALESLRRLLNGNAGSGLGKEPAPNGDQSLEIKREIEWLTAHESP